MKELRILGTDSYIDYLNRSLEQEYPETKKYKRVYKIRENLLRVNTFDNREVI